MGIGTSGPPAASAALEVKSTTGGLLLPRMTAAQRDAVPSPTNGLLVFQTDGTAGLYYYIGSGWVNATTGLVPDAAGNAGPSAAVRVSTLAGSFQGFVDGPGATAQFHAPTDVACDGSGNVYVCDNLNYCIRKILVSTGVVSTLASGSQSGYLDGTSTVAQFKVPQGVACDASGNVFVGDYGNNRIRKIVASTGAVSTLAGTGVVGTTDGIGAVAQFKTPSGLACDASGNMYVADFGNNLIRVIK